MADRDRRNLQHDSREECEARHPHRPQRAESSLHLRHGGDWRHTVTVETIGPGEPNLKCPRFVADERRCPPEDVGGLPSFEMFLDAVTNAAHENHDRLRDYYGDPYNAEDIDERFTRRAVAGIAIRRHAETVAYEKSRP